MQRRLVRDLLERRLAAELRPEESVGAVDLLQALDDVHGHADRPRLVRERPRDGLPDPPRRVGRELEAAAPVELLDGADQAERPLLDEVEERQALVAVVLGDRDDEPQVRLDHALLGLHVAALDALRELDLLRGGQELVPAGFAQEELERVGRRLHRRGDRRDDLRLRRGLLDDLDRALVELTEQRVVLQLGELVRVGQLRKVGRPDGAHLLGLLEKMTNLLENEDVLDVSLSHAATGNAGTVKLYSLASRASCLGVVGNIPRRDRFAPAVHEKRRASAFLPRSSSAMTSDTVRRHASVTNGLH